MNPNFYKNRYQFAFKPIREDYGIHLHADELIGCKTIFNGGPVELDMETAESTKPRLVYGTIICGNAARNPDTDKFEKTQSEEELRKKAKDITNYALLCIRDLSEENRKIVASVYKDIVLFDPVNDDMLGTAIPFAAFMYSCETIEETTATVMFPNICYSDEKDWLFISFANRHLLVCCEMSVPLPEDATTDTWRKEVSEAVACSMPERLRFTHDVPDYEEEFWEMLNTMSELMSEERISEKKHKSIIKGMLEYAHVTQEEAKANAEEYLDANPFFASCLENN